MTTLAATAAGTAVVSGLLVASPQAMSSAAAATVTKTVRIGLNTNDFRGGLVDTSIASGQTTDMSAWTYGTLSTAPVGGTRMLMKFVDSAGADRKFADVVNQAVASKLAPGEKLGAVSDVRLVATHFETQGDKLTAAVEIDGVNNTWKPNQVTWTKRNSTTNWKTAGGELGAALGTMQFPNQPGVAMRSSSLMKLMSSTTSSNGIELRVTSPITYSNNVLPYTSEGSDGKRPYFEVSYTVTTADPARTLSWMGTNLAGPADWEPQIPFINVLKSSRPMISAKRGTWDWSDGRALDLDANGWPRSLQSDQMARVVLFADNDKYRTGWYDVAYAGSGTLEASVPMQQVGPGHVRLDLTTATTNTIHFEITSTDATNPLRDIVVTPPGGTCISSPTTYATVATGCPSGDYLPFYGNAARIIFQPDFLARTATYGTLRFKDWAAIDTTSVTKWNDRSKVTDAQWQAKGVPLEIQIALANKLNANAWFSLPHAADDDFVTQYATLVSKTLKPALKSYVEYSNEVWNTMYPQTRFAMDRGLALGLDPNEGAAGRYYYALRSTQIHKIFVNVFGGRDRLVLVTAEQAAIPWWANRVMAYQDTAAWTDLLATAPYFGEVPNTIAERDRFLAMTKDQVLDYCANTLLPQQMDLIRQYKAVADTYKVRLGAYEGGQHLVSGWMLQDLNDPKNVALRDLFATANRDPRMGQLYQSYFDGWHAAGGAEFMHYTDIGHYTIYGNWGALESAQQTSSPKYDVLMGITGRATQVDPIA